MFRPKDTQERLIHRLKITKGHLEKVIKMVEAQEYCIDIIHQSQAVQKALKEFDNLMLENHLKTCALNHINEGRQKEAIEEVMKVLKKAK
ncbi:MAG: metal-sensing transcriptional repressor [Patescibacteria group bacterium]